jgi:hypothetical protein
MFASLKLQTFLGTGSTFVLQTSELRRKNIRRDFLYSIRFTYSVPRLQGRAISQEVISRTQKAQSRFNEDEFSAIKETEPYKSVSLAAMSFGIELYDRKLQKGDGILN